MFILLLMQCIYMYTHISQGGWTALRLAAQKGHEDIVELLLEAKADPELKTKVIIVSWHTQQTLLLCSQYKMYLLIHLSPLIAHIVDHDQPIVMGLVYTAAQLH